MGLIYVNPEGPNGNPDPIAAGRDIRETFRRMAMNDEETAALIVGGHTFGKTHGAAPATHVGPEPEGAPIEQQGIGWKSDYQSGVGRDAITSGLEGAWTNEPTRWDNGFLENLYKWDWVLSTSPAGAKQWVPSNPEAQNTVRDAFDANKRVAPVMLTTDLALRMDPVFGPITRRFYEHPDELADAFARAWYKLLHRDMGPISRFMGPWVPEPQLWQDPVPPVDHELIGAAEIADLKRRILASGLSIPQLVSTAWAAAACFRGTDKRGGANGGRLRLSPQKDWQVNDPEQLAQVLPRLEQVQTQFNDAQSGNKRVSFADVIVLGGCAAVEQAAKNAGFNIEVPFSPGRTDASQEQTDVESFSVLEPTSDGFRNYHGPVETLSPETLLLDRANLLKLTAPEMTVLVGGLRVLNANYKRSAHGVWTQHPEQLTNDFFVNLQDVNTEWKRSEADPNLFEGTDRKTGQRKWTGTAVDLVFGANSQLNAIVDYYACDDARETFARDFVAAWNKVMNLDRFDLARVS
jgi:catalase-peroxidase